MAAKYRSLADMLRGEISKLANSGRGRIPTEMEIAEQYGVSRQTVRNALDLLEQEGLIERRQGSGSYISRERVMVAASMAPTERAAAKPMVMGATRRFR